MNIPTQNDTTRQRPARDIAEAIVSKWCLLGANHDDAVEDVACALERERSAKAGTP